MTKNIFIFGSGGHAKVIADEISYYKNIKVIGYIDSIKNNEISIKKNLNSNSEIKQISFIQNKKYYGIVGIGDINKRKKVVKEISRINPNFKWISIISKKATLSPQIKIGKGSVIISGSVINAGVQIGNHSIVNTSSSIDHDCKIGNYVNISPGVIMAGSVVVGDKVLIGINSAIKENINICKNTLIGGNSFINKNITIPGTYFGSPVKKIK